MLLTTFVDGKRNSFYQYFVANLHKSKMQLLIAQM